MVQKWAGGRCDASEKESQKKAPLDECTGRFEHP